MNITFRQIILLYCLKQLNGERTIYSIYHLLQGKKSAQTIQDIHLFQLGIFFHTDTALTRGALEEQAKGLHQSGMIREIAEQHFILTERGAALLQQCLKAWPISSYLNGWKFERKDTLLWERLSLTVQVLSHLQKRETKYLPVQRKPETLLWVKDFMKTSRLGRKELAQVLYRELTSCLERGKGLDPSLLVIRLSGFRQVGLTEEQVAKALEMDQTYYHYQFLSMLHFLIDEVGQKQQEYPLLSSFLGQISSDRLTQSTEKTFSLLKQGYTLDDIINIRRLKKSTIEDHVAELALNIPEFSIDPYVTQEKQVQIEQAIQTVKTKQLREIRNFATEASYFEIRLVLAKRGVDRAIGRNVT